MKSLGSATICLMLLTGPVAAAGMDMPMAHGGKMSPVEAENAAAMQAMMKDMSVKPTGDADKDFARMMLAHHRGAIAMAKVEVNYGKDPELRTLAAGIIKAQEAEIAEMQDWLAKHP